VHVFYFIENNNPTEQIHFRDRFNKHKIILNIKQYNTCYIVSFTSIYLTHPVYCYNWNTCAMCGQVKADDICRRQPLELKRYF
jgi:hypothetical protein